MTGTVTRCKWAEGVSLDYIEYHDKEWGVPVFNDQVQFEFLILEGAQAGLSWSTILNKREGYRKAFAGFDPQKVARFTEKRIEKLLPERSLRCKRNLAASVSTSGISSVAGRSRIALKRIPIFRRHQGSLMR